MVQDKVVVTTEKRQADRCHSQRPLITHNPWFQEHAVIRRQICRK